MEQIILWECNSETIQACLLAVYETLKDLGLNAIVTVNSEPPLIGRNQLWKRLPVLEIQGLQWSLKPGCPFRTEDLKPLFSRIFAPRKWSEIGGEPGRKENPIKEGRVNMEPMTLSDADFKVKLENATGILLFYKKLCPNCKALEKVIQKFLASNEHVPYMRIDCEESPEAMKTFQTERVPTMYALRDGKVTARKVGLMNMREMIEFYESA